MKKRPDAIARVLAHAARLYVGEELTARRIMAMGVTWSTAKRDMARLEAALPVETRGGNTTAKIIRIREPQL